VISHLSIRSPSGRVSSPRCGRSAFAQAGMRSVIARASSSAFWLRARPAGRDRAGQGPGSRCSPRWRRVARSGDRHRSAHRDLSIVLGTVVTVVASILPRGGRTRVPPIAAVRGVRTLPQVEVRSARLQGGSWCGGSGRGRRLAGLFGGFSVGAVRAAGRWRPAAVRRHGAARAAGSWSRWARFVGSPRQRRWRRG